MSTRIGQIIVNVCYRSNKNPYRHLLATAVVNSWNTKQSFGSHSKSFYSDLMNTLVGYLNCHHSHHFVVVYARLAFARFENSSNCCTI